MTQKLKQNIFSSTNLGLKAYFILYIPSVVFISLNPGIEYSNTVDINRLVKSERSSKLFNSKSFYFL